MEKGVWISRGMGESPKTCMFLDHIVWIFVWEVKMDLFGKVEYLRSEGRGTLKRELSQGPVILYLHFFFSIPTVPISKQLGNGL